jgi:hypothetical protein
VDEIFTGGSCKERPDDISVSHVGQLGALPGDALNVLTESFIWLLATAPKVLGVTRVDISALEVLHENLHEVGPVMDAMGQRCSSQALAKSARNRGRLRMMKRSSFAYLTGRQGGSHQARAQGLSSQSTW